MTFEKLLATLAGVVLFGMMLLTSVDVAGRYLFGVPVTGGYEITTVLLACLIFLVLPLVCARGEHVTVDLLDKALPGRARRALLAAADTVSAAVLAVLAWQLFGRGLTLMGDGATTNTLRLPLAPVAFLMAGATALSAVVLLLKLARDLRGPIEKAPVRDV